VRLSYLRIRFGVWNEEFGYSGGGWRQSLHDCRASSSSYGYPLSPPGLSIPLLFFSLQALAGPLLI
jgi:hypothetical protein